MRLTPANTLYQTGNQILKPRNFAGLCERAKAARPLTRRDGVLCRLPQMRLQGMQRKDEKVAAHGPRLGQGRNTDWRVGFADACVTQSSSTDRVA
jgi:hypothetical protein